jgi:NAD(P)-dependent dehydrogenase (short-subunit alcohol dehydrogenase family)
MDDMIGKVAVVTGGSAGIGRAAVHAFSRRGAAVVIADRDSTRGEEVARAVKDDGGEALFVTTDVAVERDVAEMVRATVATFGRLDYAFNNAGIEGTPGPLNESSTENWDRTIAVNLTGVWLCMRAEIPAMLDGGGGAIVNCSSVAGLVGFPGLGAYVASKHGVVGLTKSVALESATSGVRVNAVCPGVIDTEMVERFTAANPDARAGLLESEPMGRMGTPEEIAESAVWLCSDASSFVTGQAIAVDGGFVTR